MKADRSLLGHPVWDLLGFGLGLALAWLLDWQTRDLVWGLWLSSLVIGYLTIVLGILGGVNRTVINNSVIGWALGIFGSLFLLAFFTVHFGGFHLVHSMFLNTFFPIVPEPKGGFSLGIDGYLLVLASYWPWLIAAASAERGALAKAWIGVLPKQPGSDKPHRMAKPGFNPMVAYVNVVRMHLLIFFFAGTHALGIDNFAIYAVVYAVYFFPWTFAKDWLTTRKAVAQQGG